MTPRQRNLLALFDHGDVRYLTIGGYSMRCHGIERTTVDIDLWVERPASNAAKIAHVIETLAPSQAPNGRNWREVFQLEACLVEYPSIGREKDVDILTGSAQWTSGTVTHEALFRLWMEYRFGRFAFKTS